VRLDQLLPQRFRTLGPEVVKFGLIGGLNFAVNWVVFNLLLLSPPFADGQLKAKVIATVVAIVSSYFMNRHWTYKDRDKSAAHREFMLFLGFNLAGMLIELAVMAATKYVFGLTTWLAINAAFVVGLALGTIFRFFTYRTWVFTHPEDTEAAVEAMGFEELTAPLEREFARGGREVKPDPAPARTR
jgi:putative flippase GtrA